MEQSGVKVLVLDVGGTHVKVRASGRAGVVKLDTGPTFTPPMLVSAVREATARWRFDAISIGVPAPVRHGEIVREPVNLGDGWVGFDFAAAFEGPVRVVNDAVMQALGSYNGGRMLFLGLGTGLGTALVDNGQAVGLELGHLPYRKGTYEDYVGDAARERMGRKRWERHVHTIATLMYDALVCESMVLGGGNARLLHALPPHARLGSNADAFPGGLRLWERPGSPADPQG
ncbi:MAG: ROK family protein [Gemmatimonadetes bacterium SCN 70-22]|nr:MAG: ROK family protein [Gemmatimonadetes bacterium SCN 70-22]